MTTTSKAADRYRVFAVDQRGHGESAWPRDYGVDSLAADLLGLIERLGIGPVRLIGHSLGGLASLVALARHPNHPVLARHLQA